MSWQCPACGSQADTGHSCYTPSPEPARKQCERGAHDQCDADIARLTRELAEARAETQKLEREYAAVVVKLANRIVAESTGPANRETK